MEKSLIAQLKEKKAQLETALAKSLTEKEFDLLDAELKKVSKTLILAENQERQRQEKEAAEARQEAIAEFEKERARINSLLEKANLMDKIIFDEMTTVYYKAMEAFDMRVQAAEDTKALQINAQTLELDPPESVIVTLCGVRTPTPGGGEDYFKAFVEQFDLSARALKGAKKNNVPGAPKRPGMDWFFKGHGEYYPRDPEPPNPPKDMYSGDPAKREQAKREYELTLKRAKAKNGQATVNTN